MRIARTFRTSVMAPFRVGRTGRVTILLAMVLVLNGVDLAYTQLAAQSNLLFESNPLARCALVAGDGGLFLFKIVMAGSGCLTLWALRAHRWAVPACWLLLVAYAALGVMWYCWSQDADMYYQAKLTLFSRHFE